MNSIVILLIALACLVLGYIFYGSWLAKKWGVDPNRETPAHTNYDGRDYVPAHPAVLMGHHFSSIAGAGPINGPIQAAVFGWVPVFLWVVLGGIFFGAMHDFGALFASIRHGGKSIAEVIRDTMGDKAQRLFTIFALLVLILVIASFTAVVAGTFVSVAGKGEAALPLFTTNAVSANASTAMTSLLFIILAFFFGFAVYRRNVKVGPATIIGIVGIVLIVWLGLKVGINMSRTAWVIFIAVYIAAASLLPVWMLLQPRDYLSSFLLYGMMILAIFGICGAHPNVELPAVTGWTDTLTKTLGGKSNIGTLFPALFITVACGACSGFHSLVASGTTTKQISSEKDAKTIGYGAMIIESALAVISLIAIGAVWHVAADGSVALTGYNNAAYSISAPPTIFAGGIASMIASFCGGKTYGVIYTLLTLAVSVFALTSLDTGTRLGRYMFSELFTPEGKTYKDLTGFRKFLVNPYTATIVLVVIGCGMGFMGLSQIWGVFGAANQLLAGIAMLAVATWLGNVGKSNKMFFFPMVFMLIATITSLVMTIIKKFAMIGGGTAAWGDWFQLIWSVGLVVLAVMLVVQGVGVLSKQGKKAAENK
ncbi:MAG TPA: carbon starvation protein A [Oscillospiraceae bacterium]|nr:carbon starvation protein A [Oscillospiraceae bacterium]